MKKDVREGSKTVTPVEAGEDGVAAVVDLDDMADEEFAQLDTKRRKPSVRASAKKQKVSPAVEVKKQNKKRGVPDAAETSVEVGEADSGMQGDARDDDEAPEEVEREELDKDDVDCRFIESSRIPAHVAQKDYPHRYVEFPQVDGLQASNEKSKRVRLVAVAVICIYFCPFPVKTFAEAISFHLIDRIITLSTMTLADT